MEVSQHTGKLTIDYPTPLETDCPHPIVAWGNGTSVQGVYAFLNSRLSAVASIGAILRTMADGKARGGTQPGVRAFGARAPRAARAGLLVLACALLWSAACSRHHRVEAGPPPEPLPAAANPAQAAPQPAAEPPIAAQPWQPSAPDQAAQRANDLAQDQAHGQPQAEPDPGAAEADKPPRDFSAELGQMMAGAASCLSPRSPEQPYGPLYLDLTAHVMPGGGVSRGEVSGGELQGEEGACVQRMLEAAHFAPPIENAPLAVHATLRLDPPIAKASPPQPAAPPKPTYAAGYDPGVIPPADPGVVPPADPGVIPPSDPGVVPTPDPPAEVMPIPEPIAPPPESP
jgi:hypothetical protein